MRTRSAETTQPGQEFLVAIRCSGKLGGAQKSTSSTERGDRVTIRVGIHAADNIGIGKCHTELLFPAAEV